MAATRWPGEPVTEYVDNDISASRQSHKSRVAFQQLCADIESHAVTALVGWDFDRLFRQPRELEAFLDLADRARFTRALTAQGDVDLTTEDGRLHARIMVAVAAKESDAKSRRVRRKNQDRRERGEHQGSRVVFGYRLIDGRPELEPDAAQLVRGAAAAVLAGESLSAVARRMADAGSGAPRTGAGVKKMLLSATLVARNSAGVRGDWTPILTDEDYANLHALLTAPDRLKNTSHGERRWWLTGLVYCAVCTAPMKIASDNGGASYVCGAGFCVSIRAKALSRHVEVAIFDSVLPERAQAPTPFTPGPDVERLAELAGMYAAGDITRAEWVSARAAVPAAPDPVSSDRKSVV